MSIEKLVIFTEMPINKIVYFSCFRTGVSQIVGQVPPGVGSVTFGGPGSNTLFAVVGSSVINPVTREIVQRNTGPSVYKIRIPGARGRKYQRVMI